ncbi:STAS domain-containing protein [Streptomyces sp. NPDC016566]|uniref:STAS domain-containing protein n=1 Tax=Streptomyces sp. NPDC016566 TaxID=3364967 RepID=UPI0036FFC9F2
MSDAGESHETPSGPVRGQAPEPPTVLQHEQSGAWVIVAHGSFDMDSIPPLRKAMETAAAAYSKVIVDISGVTFADSTFLNLLLRVHRLSTLRVVGPSPQFERVLAITGADTVLDIRTTVADAVT